MKFKKIMLITLLLLAVLTVGAVSAADDGVAEDLAVDDVGGGDLADTPIKDADLLSNDDEGDGDDDGSGESDEIDYQVDAVTEFYINNESNVVFSLVCPDEATGKFVVDVTKDVENSDPEYINTFEHPILESEWGKQINFTVGELGITQNGFYNFELYHLQNDGDECNDDTYIDDFGADAFDSTEFRIVDTFDEADVNALAVNIPVFGLYCPDGHEGIVTVTVRLDRDEVALITNNTRQKNDDNLIYWYMPELNLTFVDNKYTINVKVNDDEFEEEWDVWFNNPVSFGEYSYVNMSDIFVNVEVPSEIEDGRIIIEVDGGVVFNKTLSEFPSTNDEFDYYYWHPPYHGPGEGDLRFKLYRIHNDVIEDAEAKEYNVTASLILDKREFIYNGSYTLRVPNIAENDGVSIQLINYTSFDIDDEWAEIAYISAPEGADGIIIVSSGDGILFEENFYDLTDGGDFYLFRAGELDIREPGEYEITFAYWNGDELVVENTATFYFYRSVIIYVPEESDGGIYFLDKDEDLERFFAIVSVQNELRGNITITVYDEDDDEDVYFFNSALEDIANKEEDSENDGFTRYMISLKNLTDVNDFVNYGRFKIEFLNADDEYNVEDSREYNIDYDDGDNSVIFREAENDAEDGVIIYVPDGDDKKYYLDDDLNTPFAFVSVQNDIGGDIVIYVFDEREDDEQEFFRKDISEITDKENDANNEGFTVYRISLNDLENYEDLIKYGSFKLAFEDNIEEELDSRWYTIDYNDEDNIVTFWEDDEDYGNIEIEDIIFQDANAADDDVIVMIPKTALPEEVDDEFKVSLDLWEDKYEKTLKLSEIENDTDYYFIKVSDLIDDASGIEEQDGSIKVEFKKGDQIYYAEDEITVYSSPFFDDESSILSDDVLIIFRGLPEGADDEFTVTVSKEGSEPIIKTFKMSDLLVQDEEEEEEDDEGFSFYELKVSDLGITEAGNYNLLINFTEDGEFLKSYSGNVEISLVNIYEDKNTEEIEGDDGEIEDIEVPFSNVGDTIFYIRISKDNTDFYVKLYKNDNQVGENILLSDLPYYDHWGHKHDSRLILLNDFNITESGNYTFKVEFYNSTGALLAEKTNEAEVEVGETEVRFSDCGYGCDIFDCIEISIAAPVSPQDYFNIYLNGELAGTYTPLDGEFTIDDKFYDRFRDNPDGVKFLKGGHYDVNITFVENGVESDCETGEFDVLKLNLTSDKDAYLLGDDIFISFEGATPVGKLSVYYVSGWGEMGPDDHSIIEDADASEFFNNGVFKINAKYNGYKIGDNYILVEYYIPSEEEGEDGISYCGLIKINVVEAPEPVSPELSIDSVSDVEEGSDVTITIHALGNFTGSVKVLVGNVEVGSVAVSAGSGTFTIPAGNLTVGLNTVKITSEANENFTAGEANVAFNVTAKVIPPVVLDPNLTISVDDIREGTNAVIVITTNDTFSGIVKVQIGTGNYNVSVINGTGSYSVPGLAVGNYTATATFEATEAFNASTKNATFKVNKEVVPDAETSISTDSASVSSKNPVYSIN